MKVRWEVDRQWSRRASDPATQADLAMACHLGEQAATFPVHTSDPASWKELLAIEWKVSAWWLAKVEQGTVTAKVIEVQYANTPTPERHSVKWRREEQAWRSAERHRKRAVRMGKAFASRQAWSVWCPGEGVYGKHGTFEAFDAGGAISVAAAVWGVKPAEILDAVRRDMNGRDIEDGTTFHQARK